MIAVNLNLFLATETDTVDINQSKHTITVKLLTKLLSEQLENRSQLQNHLLNVPHNAQNTRH